MIRPTTPVDIEPLVAMTTATGFFKPHEVEALREVLDDYFAAEYESGHQCVTFDDGTVRGFAYFGPEPMTIGTWLLWWIVVSPSDQGRGLGGQLLRHAEQCIRDADGRMLFIETSSLPLYEATRQFYLRYGYEIEGTLRDFYSAGDGKVVFRKALAS